MLFKDLCGRLPYHVEVKIWLKEGTTEEGALDLEHNYADVLTYAFYFDEIIDIKPYLFPLSSMTEEQYEKFIIISGWDGDIEDIRRGKFSCIGYIGLDYIYDTIDWLNKNHFDYRGLIEKGLAIDCTNLNIY